MSGDNTTGTTWATAKTSIEAGIAIATADGDIIYVDSAHSFSKGSAITYNAATSGQNLYIISVDRNGSTTTGHNGWQVMTNSETTSANGSGINCLTSGAQNLYMYGIRLVSNNGNSNANDITLCSERSVSCSAVFESCTFELPGTSTGLNLFIGGAGSATNFMNRWEFNNCTFKITNAASTGSVVLRSGQTVMRNLAIDYAGAGRPTGLFAFAVGGNTFLELHDSDLSGYLTTAGSYFVVTSWQGGHVLLRNCKLNSTPVLQSGTWDSNRVSITSINVDSGDTFKTFEYRTALGTLTENTAVYADNGAKFINGNAGISWQIDTSSLATPQRPFITPWVKRYAGTTTEIDVGLRVIRDNVTDLNNQNTWAEIEYVSSASFPIGTLATNRNATPFDNAGTDYTNDSEPWTESFTNPNSQTIQSTFTPAEGSLLRGRLLIGVASTTVYLDPCLRIEGFADSPKTYWSDCGADNIDVGSTSAQRSYYSIA